jgi:hypothetical protein
MFLNLPLKPSRYARTFSATTTPLESGRMRAAWATKIEIKAMNELDQSGS